MRAVDPSAEGRRWRLSLLRLTDGGQEYRKREGYTSGSGKTTGDADRPLSCRYQEPRGSRIASTSFPANGASRSDQANPLQLGIHGSRKRILSDPRTLQHLFSPSHLLRLLPCCAGLHKPAQGRAGPEWLSKDAHYYLEVRQHEGEGPFGDPKPVLNDAQGRPSTTLGCTLQACDGRYSGTKGWFGQGYLSGMASRPPMRVATSNGTRAHGSKNEIHTPSFLLLTVMSAVLPPELEREIFEVAAKQYPEDIPTLVLVAKRVHIWCVRFIVISYRQTSGSETMARIQPMLFRIVRSSNSKIWPVLLEKMDSDPELLRNGVRFVCLEHGAAHFKLASQEQLERLLQICTGVVDIGAIGTHTDYFLPVFAGMENLRRLVASSTDLFGNAPPFEPTHAALSRITHLEVVNQFYFGQEQDRALFHTICHLPSLTHLAITPSFGTGEPSPWEAMQGVLDKTPALKMLVLLWDQYDVRDHFDAVNKSTLKDLRVVAGSFACEDDNNMWSEWEDSARGIASDYWARGELFLERKRKREVEASRLWMDDWINKFPLKPSAEIWSWPQIADFHTQSFFLLTVMKTILPFELEREIFERMAKMSPRDIPALLRVARRVHVWIRPMIFRVVRSSNSKMWPALLAVMESDPDVVRNGVRFICLEHEISSVVSREQLRGLLHICTQVVDFGAVVRYIDYLPSLARMENLRRLSVSLPEVFGDLPFNPFHATHISMSRITHLEVVDQLDLDADDASGPLDSFACLPALTHLAITPTTSEIPWPRIQKALDAMPRLEMFVLLWDRIEVHNMLETIPSLPLKDLRVVAGSFETDGFRNMEERCSLRRREDTKSKPRAYGWTTGCMTKKIQTKLLAAPTGGWTKMARISHATLLLLTIMSTTLPPELEREIFEAAAQLNPEDTPTLLRVAKRVYAWIRPFLFRVIRGKNEKLWPPLLLAMEAEPDFLRKSVRFVCIEYGTDQFASAKQIKTLLQICTEVVDVALTSTVTVPMNGYLDLLARMPRLRRLTCSLRELFVDESAPIDPRHEGLSRITHLEILDDISSNDDGFWLGGVPLLPSLTHLAITISPEDSDPDDELEDAWGRIQRILDAIPPTRLRVLALVWTKNEAESYFDVVNSATIRDPRLVAGSFEDLSLKKHVYDAWCEWEESAMGLSSDYWERAELFLERRRNGEVPASRIWMEDWLYDENESSSDSETSSSEGTSDSE
uniref:F-box domain-containing protein n=1 Tax=Mycena chlorophos TaxID=658473 RepID=A0ABQ0LAZ3_MYCCL|nr:predicted protein [Mycena chlorophos]